MSGTSRSSAARRMRVAQVLGLCMVALAAGAVVFKPGLPEGRPQTATDPGDEAVISGPVDAPADSGRSGIDSATVGGTLNGIARIILTPKEPAPTGDPRPEEPTKAVGWMYLGGVFEPTTSFAFVSIGGSQRMIRQGQHLSDLDTKVISISPERIEIERSGRRERIDRAEPVGAMVSVNQAMPGAATIISPGVSGAREARMLQREEMQNNPDIEKRRAEFQRRQLEREGQER